MSREFSIEEKIYNKILLLQANDEFMADVLAIRKKCADVLDQEEIDGHTILYSYEDTAEYDEEVKGLLKKYNLSNLFQLHLKHYIPNGSLMILHGYKFNILGHPIPVLVPEAKPELVVLENGEEFMDIPDIRDEQRVVIEIFPETTLKDFVNNWDKIAEKRDELYGINSKKTERFMKSKNVERDLLIYELRKQGKTGKDITAIINGEERFKNERIAYQDVSKIVKRLKEKAKRITPRKET